MQLRDYQSDIAGNAAGKLHQYGMAYLSMQVRTGKTLTALEAAKRYGAKKVLFLTTKKAMGSIAEDFKALAPGYRLDIINYEQAHKIEEEYDVVICDEAHKLGQYPKPAQTAQFVKLIIQPSKKAKVAAVIFLSGTPTPESESQIYHQLWVSPRSPLAQYNTFYAFARAGFIDVRKRYVFNRELNDYSHAHRALIDKAVGHLFLSYSQAQAGFIQDVKEEVIVVEMKRGTYNLAGKLLRDRVVIGQDGSEILADTEVKLQQKLHQIYSGTVLTEAGEPRAFDCSKVDAITHLFVGKKIAIFYKFKAEFEMLKSKFGSRLTDSPEVFRSAGSERIFCSQIQSGREGINLSTADCLIMFNIDFSSVSYQQARARLQSKDRTKECLLYWLFAKGGIERRIYEAVQAKQDYTLRFFRRDFNIQKALL